MGNTIWQSEEEDREFNEGENDWESLEPFLRKK